MDYNTDWYPGCTNDPDWQDRDNHYDNHDERVYDRVTETLQLPANDVFATVLDYADETKIAETLKAMIIAYDNFVNASKKVNREQSEQDFIVFAKSFACVCITGIESEAKND
jgi:hypothetical protein